MAEPNPTQSGITHRQVTVTVANWEAEVDEGMAPLIEALWRRGIYTDFSCQGEPDGNRLEAAYLSMPVGDFMRFLDLAADVFELTRGSGLHVHGPVDGDRGTPGWRSAS